MARKTSQSSDRSTPPNLVVARLSAYENIQNQVEKGLLLRTKQIKSLQDLEDARSERLKWSRYNSELLLRLFDNSTMVDEYEKQYARAYSLNPSFSEKVTDFCQDMDDKINRLEAIRDRLDLIPEPQKTEFYTSISETNKKYLGQDVFLVHGHDEASKEAVSRFIEKLGLKVVILHEQPNAGRTIIEKFENHANVGFAIVLLTPDDIGTIRDKPKEEKPRARQNVIFEFGYFISKLGRERVCALYKEEIELPTDLYGILYIPLDDAGAWRLKLAREIANVGIPVDMNRVI